MREEIMRYGANGDAFGILTLPERSSQLPIVVMFNAGLLHRSEPYRLNVLAARALCDLGVMSLRVDLAGKGDSPARTGCTNRESVAMDWAAIRQSLCARFGDDQTFILMGLCSGADNAIKLGRDDAQVAGLILIDPVALKDRFFLWRKIWRKLSDPRVLRQLPAKLLARLSRLLPAKSVNMAAEKLSLRDEPTPDDIRECIRRLVSCRGHIFAVFTSFASGYYNKKGQFAQALNIAGAEDICNEEMWFDATHLLSVHAHRERFVNALVAWFKRIYEEKLEG